MITGSINLTALKHVKMEKKGKTGMIKGIFIPLEANELQEHEKGGIYLNLVAFEMKEPKDYADHIVKQNLPKEKREAMTQEQKNEMPILGNLKAKSTQPSDFVADEGGGTTFLEDDDLPF